MTKPAKLFLAIALILPVSQAATNSYAQDNSFTGFTSSDWEDSTNWSNGAVPNADNVRVGEFIWASPVTAEITGALTNPAINDLRVGADELGEGTIDHSDGSLTATGWSFVGVDGGTGTYNLSGTASHTVDLTANNGEQQFHVGLGGTDGSTGVVNISDSAELTFPRGFVGSNSGSSGTINQTGGSVNVTDWLALGREQSSLGTYNMSGGSLTVMNDALTVGEFDGSTGVMTVSNDASVSTVNLMVGRFGMGAEGTLNIIGGDATVNASGLMVVGVDDGNDFMFDGVFIEDDSAGTLYFESDSSGVSSITVGGDVHLNTGTIVGSSTLSVDLTTNPVAAANVPLISIGGSLFGSFTNLAEGDVVPNSGGRTLTYSGGDGNDIWLMGMSTGVDGDFDDNGIYECADVDDLVAEIAAGTNNASFDLNNDSVVDGDDLTAWLAEAGSIGGLTTSGNPVLPGDANLDGSVDGQDFVIWNANKFTSTAAWCSGDFSADGAVDGQDFVIWNGSKFQTADGVSSVPEPAGLAMVLFGCLAFFRRR